MRTLATGISTDSILGRCRQRAFSLLELLVVVAIIGVLAGALVLSGRNISGPYRQLEQEAFVFRGLLQLLREEALMQNRDYGVEFSQTSYRFYVYDFAQRAWVRPPNEQLFLDRDTPAAVSLELRVEDRDLVLDDQFDEPIEDEEAPAPQLILFSSGQFTPFEVDFLGDRGDGRFIVAGDVTGELTIQREGFDALQ